MPGLVAAVGVIGLQGATPSSPLFETTILSRWLWGIKNLLEAPSSLDDPHIEFVLLRTCFTFPKFVFSVWTMNRNVHNEVSQDFDREVHMALSAILVAPIPDPQWILA